MKHLVSLVLCSLLAVACSAARPGGILYVDPKEYPCGINGVYPTTHPLPCCYEGDTACGVGPGFDPTCPAGQCAYVGAYEASRSDAGTTGTRRYRPMRTQ